MTPFPRLIRGAAAAVGFLLLAATPARSSEPDDLLGRARLASERNDHAAAIEAYHRALELDGSLRDSVAVALAAQLTWAGRYEEAIEEFRGHLVRHPNDIEARRTLSLAQSWSGRTADALSTYRAILLRSPNDLDAAFGVARMHSWLGHTTRAVRGYEDVLARQPDHAGAALGLAMVHNWRGDHEKAARLFSEITALNPAGPDAWVGLGWARHWSGRDDLALQALDRQVAAGAASKDGDALRRIVVDAWLPRALSTFDYGEDSDYFTTEAARIEFEAPLGYRAHARLGALKNRFSRKGKPDVEDTWVLLSGDARVGRLVSSSALQLAVERPSGADYFPLQADLNLGWIAGDRLRFDANYGHFAAFSYAFHERTDRPPRRIVGDLGGAGVSWRPEHATTLVLSGERARYAEVGDRSGFRARVRRSLFPRRPRLAVEMGTQWLDFERKFSLPPGIWTPDAYRAWYARADAEVFPDGRFTLLGSADGGWAREAAIDFQPYVAWSAGAVWRTRAVRIEARGGHSDSNLGKERGYRRSFASLFLTAGF